MSGGVDSSVAAALMVEKYGKDAVFGVTMRLFCYAEAEALRPIRQAHGKQAQGKQDDKSCCSLSAINDAKAICNHLGIRHYTINMEKEFEKAVIKNFISEYKKGHTPIPCVPCNTIIKFDYLLKKVQQLGADLLVTGHYVRISARVRPLQQGSDPNGEKTYRLLKGIDETKDQSYFLYGLSQKQLAHTEFPLGEMKKTEVRKIAAKIGLKTAKKTESQGICFVQVADSRGSRMTQIHTDKYRVTDWLYGKVKNKPGDIVDTSGNIVGKHEGIVFYTVGQRKRVGGGFPEPMYVLSVDAGENQVVIGTKKELLSKELTAEKMHWINPVKLPVKCKAKIRYNMDDVSCIVSERGQTLKQSQGLTSKGKISVRFTKPQRAITPGQSLVLYKGDEVLGGGIIS